MDRHKTAAVYSTAIAAISLLFLAAFFLNLLPWTSSAPAAGRELPAEPPAEAIMPVSSRRTAVPEEPLLFEGNINRLPPEMIVDMLSFLQMPIAGARIGMTDGQLPGAPRRYRNGTHQGIDFYNGFCGVPIQRGTPVLAAADGKVIRIDHTYTELTPDEVAKYREISAASQTTPESILDKFRGRQVWLEHSGKVITRYAHLDSVNAELTVGDTVTAGQVIGYVGNSGTPQAAAGLTGEEIHLHFEIWLNGFYLGERLPPDTVRSILRGILE